MPQPLQTFSLANVLSQVEAIKGARLQNQLAQQQLDPNSTRNRLLQLQMQGQQQGMDFAANQENRASTEFEQSQEVEKLKLLAPDGRIGCATVTDAVSDNARFNLFDMTDRALSGDASGSLRMLHGLRGEGSEPAVVLWALAREIRTLHQVQLDCEGGQAVQQALAAHRVWKSRTGLMETALARHDGASLSRLLAQAARVDGSIKGFADGRPWDHLEDLVVGLAQPAS